MGHVMISYARSDRPLAERLAGRLTAEGFDVWFDRDIPPGATFDVVIDDALRTADAVVVLWSRQSVGSRWVVAEAAEAAARMRLVPARLDDAVVPLEFRRLQTADLIGWDGEPSHPGYRSLVRALHAGSSSVAAVPDGPSATVSTAHGTGVSSRGPRRIGSAVAVVVVLLVVAALALVRPWAAGNDGTTSGTTSGGSSGTTTGGSSGTTAGGSSETTAGGSSETTSATPGSAIEALLGGVPLTASIDQDGPPVGTTGDDPVDVVREVATSFVAGCADGRWAIVDRTDGTPTEVVVDLALPCLDRSDSGFPFASGLRFVLVVDEASDGTWTVIRARFQVACPRGVERGALCNP